MSTRAPPELPRLSFDTLFHLPIYDLPATLLTHFSPLRGSALYYVGTVDKIHSAWGGVHQLSPLYRDSRVVLVSDSALFLCTREGRTKRCIPIFPLGLSIASLPANSALLAHQYIQQILLSSTSKMEAYNYPYDPNDPPLGLDLMAIFVHGQCPLLLHCSDVVPLANVLRRVHDTTVHVAARGPPDTRKTLEARDYIYAIPGLRMQVVDPDTIVAAVKSSGPHELPTDVVVLSTRSIAALAESRAAMGLGKTAPGFSVPNGTSFASPAATRPPDRRTLTVAPPPAMTAGAPTPTPMPHPPPMILPPPLSQSSSQLATGTVSRSTLLERAAALQVECDYLSAERLRLLAAAGAGPSAGSYSPRYPPATPRQRVLFEEPGPFQRPRSDPVDPGVTLISPPPPPSDRVSRPPHATQMPVTPRLLRDDDFPCHHCGYACHHPCHRCPVCGQPPVFEPHYSTASMPIESVTAEVERLMAAESIAMQRIERAERDLAALRRRRNASRSQSSSPRPLGPPSDARGHMDPHQHCHPCPAPFACPLPHGCSEGEVHRNRYDHNLALQNPRYATSSACPEFGVREHELANSRD